MADVRPFRALRYAPDLDLAAAICPPFDTISREQQRALHERSAYNAVRIELADDTGGERYRRAAETLQRWRRDGTLSRDEAPAFYVYRQRFQHEGRDYTRTLLFARLRLEPWDRGVVLPHEQTFGGPKEDRLKLLRATRLNASPVFLFYRDPKQEIARLLAPDTGAEAIADFTGDDGQRHTLLRVADSVTVASLGETFASRTLYVGDGHHRYETALGYLGEVRSQASQWTGEEPENFALVALAAADDPGLLVLPIHRVAAAGVPLSEALARLRPLFHIQELDGGADVLAQAVRARGSAAFGLAADTQRLMLLLVRGNAVDRLLPQDRSPAWRKLDYAVANHAILGHALGLTKAQMSDYSAVWFTEDANEAIAAVRSGRACYAVLLNPAPVGTILEVADAGERMPQKSTFFYPKVPTGLVFNPLED